ncbi:WXG100 family type VII secretion target [Streptomyces sp. SID11385]|uniref:WXG100 family type VII secretion target n=1 Tax=Streptomyces sp. SID11385 TaxID=2706031 RepID=UPI0013CBD736|nr:WXG100 family type VII secretion target [Streptomyces sp. SID11385]NEA41775.1 hypothetical protein [Streptomyces sp. SID11385]
MADTSTAPKTAAQWAVALSELHSAIGKVKGYSHDISGYLVQIGNEFDRLGDNWRSPAAASAEPVAEWFTRSARDLRELLEDMIRRMQASYESYLDAETKNYHNAT